MKSVLLFTFTTFSTKHFFMLKFASFHVDILFKWIQVQECQTWSLVLLAQ